MCGRLLDVKYSDSSFSGTPPFLLFSMFKYFFMTFLLTLFYWILFGTAQMARLAPLYPVSLFRTGLPSEVVFGLAVRCFSELCIYLAEATGRGSRVVSGEGRVTLDIYLYYFTHQTSLIHS